MKANANLILSPVIPWLLLAALQGCHPNEQRLREIVREEITAAATRTIITDPNTIGPYSPAQRIGNLLFVSGQIALDPRTGTLNNAGIEAETRQALENLMRILRSAGYDSSNVVSTTVYLRDIADYPKMNNIYGGYFAEGRYPARTTVQVGALPREARVEISAIAIKFS